MRIDAALYDPRMLLFSRLLFIVVIMAASPCPVMAAEKTAGASRVQTVIEVLAGMQVCQPKDGGTNHEGRFVVYIPQAYDRQIPLPLVVSSHGAGGNGETEFAGSGWGPLAERYGFIVICPSYASAVATTNESVLAGIQQDHPMLRDILTAAASTLKIDGARVMHTGFSGGGVPTYYVALMMPRVFTAICLRSGNYYGRSPYGDAGLSAADVNFSPFTKKVALPHSNLDIVLRQWNDRPICTFWGRTDHPIIIEKNFRGVAEGPEGLAFLLNDIGGTRIHHFIHDGGHDSRAELAAEWFARYAWFAGEHRPSKRS